MDRVNARSYLRRDLSPRAGNNQDVLVFRSVLVDVRDFLVNITLHSTAQRRVKLRKIANLHCLLAVVGQARRLPTIKSAGGAPALQFSAIGRRTLRSLMPLRSNR